MFQYMSVLEIILKLSWFAFYSSSMSLFFILVWQALFDDI